MSGCEMERVCGGERGMRGMGDEWDGRRWLMM